MGKLTISSNHVLHNSGGSYSISALMQEHMCYLGQQLVFAEASATIERFLQIEVNAKQIERLCHYYGQQLEILQQRDIANGGQSKEILLKDPHYAMVDGGMLLTREEKWKEMKLARIFKDSELIAVSKKRNEIMNSLYIAHLGCHEDFVEKVEYQLDNIVNKIFIADGATWIWNWVQAKYPDATQILDFYHAKEHLCEYAAMQFKDIGVKHNWIDAQCELLLDNQLRQVLTNIKKLPARGVCAKKQKATLLEYYRKNSKRMQYKTFKENNLLIGSGPIEAAHRNVIQQRMKLSGQRWTKKGAQQMANLRVAHKSNQWNQVVELIKMAA